MADPMVVSRPLAPRQEKVPRLWGVSVRIARGLFVLFLVYSVAISIRGFTLHCSVCVVKAFAP